MGSGPDGAHKGNQVLGQALLAIHGRTRIIGETGAGQHGYNHNGVLFDLHGRVGIIRQANVEKRMELMGATVPVTARAAGTLKGYQQG